MTNEVDIHKDYKSLKNVMENSVSGKNSAVSHMCSQQF